MSEQFKAPPIPPRAPAVEISKTTSQQAAKGHELSEQQAHSIVHANQNEQTQLQFSESQINQTSSRNEENGKYDDNFAADFNLPPSVITTKSIFVLLLIVCVLGIIIGSVFLGSSSTPQVVGLQGVVPNQDVTTRLPRCGRTDPGQACILYIMNHTRYDKIAENFFDDAVRLTEVQKYSIAMVNPKYAKTRIPPGYFAEIKIPNVR